MHELNKLLMMPETEKSERGLLYTPHEIAQQPKTWRKTYLRFEKRLKDINEFLERNTVKGDARSRPAVFLVGAGTSDYVGKSLVTLLKQKWQCEVEAISSTDLLTEMDDLILSERNYLWVSFSRSGDSSEGVAVLKSALEKYTKVSHFIITCNENGSMARDFRKSERVFCLTLDDEVNDRGLAMTSSFSNMIVAGHCLANFQQLAEYAPVLVSMIRAGEDFLGSAATVASELSEEGFAKICFLGTGALRGAAVESALKVLELTAGRIYTFSESFLGLRHGPLSAIDKNTLVVGFLSENSRRRSYEVDLLAEIRKKQLAGRILTVSASGSLTGGGGGSQLSETRLTIDFQQKVADVYRVPVDVIFGQLFGLFSSLANGLKPDTPSPTGAISRVVESVKVY